MALFKVLANGQELMVEATKKFSLHSWYTRDVRARIGEKVTIENGKGLTVTGVRIATRPDNEQAFDVKKIIGEALKDARQRRGLTQVEVAEAMHSSREYVSYLEGGKRNMAGDSIQRYLDAIGVKKVEIKFY